jgi:hypothetical protein
VTTDRSFDTWWPLQLRRPLFRNMEPSVLGLLLHALLVFPPDAGWERLRGMHAEEIAHLGARYTHGTLWTSCDKPRVNEAAEDGQSV